jgi:hypothetical protein
MTRSARRRLVAFAAGLTLAVGVLGGVVAAMVASADLSASLPEVRIGWTVTVLLAVAVALLYVAVPVGIAAVLAREHGHPLVYGAAALTTVLFPVAVPVALLWTVGVGPEVGSALSRFVATVVGAIALLVCGVVAFERATSAEDDGWMLALNVAVVLVFLLGFLGVQVVAPGFADRHTTDTRPDVELEFEERTTDDGRLLVVEHAGGEPAPVDRLDIRGEGFADVEGADQTEPGPWAGEATGRAPRGGGPAVVEGDTVTVGVADDCGFIIGPGPELRGPVEYYDCSEP